MYFPPSKRTHPHVVAVVSEWSATPHERAPRIAHEKPSTKPDSGRIFLAVVVRRSTPARDTSYEPTENTLLPSASSWREIRYCKSMVEYS
uniref:Uncharacterized protein n=1 Tax=Anopheles arabiensis TaxID=7173 RepID=A0A182I2E3_ANOAR